MAMSIFLRTLPYVGLRALAYLIFAIVTLIYLAIVVAIAAALVAAFKGAGFVIFLFLLVALLGLWGILRLLERYVLYLIKAGHVAVITELVTKGDLPSGQGQIAYGRQMIAAHFGTTTAFAAVDALVEGAVRQVLRFLTGAAGIFSFIPGFEVVWGIVRRILSLAANYIDEAVLSYILSHKNESNVWRAAADGVVLYAQCWQSLLWRATLLMLLVAVVWLAALVIAFLALLPLISLWGGPSLTEAATAIAFVGALVMATMAKWILVDPIATVGIVAAFQQAIVNQTPSVDLYDRLSSVSARFRQLGQRAQSAEATKHQIEEAKMDVITIGTIVIAVLVFIVVSAAIRVAQEYERGVIFRLGRLVGTRGPGLFFMIPFVERQVKADLRVVTMEVPSQEVITKDNVTVKVTAVVFFRVITPEDSVVKVLDFIRATSQISQTTLRSVLGQSELDELLAERERLNQRLQQIIDEQTEPWGIKVSVVEIKDVELPDTMKRAMSRQAEAERERRAKVIHADGEFQASQRLADAAQIISGQPISLQLRYLQTLTEIATERTSTLVFPLPLDIITPFLRGLAAPTTIPTDTPPAT